MHFNHVNCFIKTYRAETTLLSNIIAVAAKQCGDLPKIRTQLAAVNESSWEVRVLVSDLFHLKESGSVNCSFALSIN